MEKSQYELCASVLRRMDDAGVLPGVVIIGSWCVLFYERYFNTTDYRASIRTRDLDIAIPLPPRFAHKVDLADQLGELGFVVDFKWTKDLSLALPFLQECGRDARAPGQLNAKMRIADLILNVLANYRCFWHNYRLTTASAPIRHDA